MIGLKCWQVVCCCFMEVCPIIIVYSTNYIALSKLSNESRNNNINWLRTPIMYLLTLICFIHEPNRERKSYCKESVYN